MGPGMPAHQARQRVRAALLDAILFLFPWLHRHLPEPRPYDENDFSRRRIAIASAICLRLQGTEEINEYTSEVDAWLNLRGVPHHRKLLLIQANIPVTEAASEHARDYSDADLRTMIALRRMAAR